MMINITLISSSREQIIDLTGTLSDQVKKHRWQAGILLVYSPHTTAGITVNENADPDVKRDLLNFLSHSIPRDWAFCHSEGNSDAHIKGSLLNFSQAFIVEKGQIQLGTWQGTFFVEGDGPREREVWLKFVPG